MLIQSSIARNSNSKLVRAPLLFTTDCLFKLLLTSPGKAKVNWTAVLSELIPPPLRATVDTKFSIYERTWQSFALSNEQASNETALLIDLFPLVALTASYNVLLSRLLDSKESCM